MFFSKLRSAGTPNRPTKNHRPLFQDVICASRRGLFLSPLPIRPSAFPPPALVDAGSNLSISPPQSLSPSASSYDVPFSSFIFNFSPTRHHLSPGRCFFRTHHIPRDTYGTNPCHSCRFSSVARARSLSWVLGQDHVYGCENSLLRFCRWRCAITATLTFSMHCRRDSNFFTPQARFFLLVANLAT